MDVKNKTLFYWDWIQKIFKTQLIENDLIEQLEPDISLPSEDSFTPLYISFQTVQTTRELETVQPSVNKIRSANVRL